MRLILGSFFGGMGAATAIIVAVFATGQTFGQRCAKHFTGAEIDRCVAEMASGERRFPTDEKGD
ncbi:MAG: hypothetical protein AAFR11_05735 [Pseudomonadota bacterium]